MILDVHAANVSTKMLTAQSPNVRANGDHLDMDSNTRKTVATNVKRLRALRGWTQTDLGTKSGIAQTTISSVERPEDKSPTLDTLSQLAAAFDVPPWTLLVDLDGLDAGRLRAMDGLVRSFAKLPPDGQDQVSRVAEAEMRYSKVS